MSEPMTEESGSPAGIASDEDLERARNQVMCACSGSGKSSLVASRLEEVTELIGRGFSFTQAVERVLGSAGAPQPPGAIGI